MLLPTQENQMVEALSAAENWRGRHAQEMKDKTQLDMEVSVLNRWEKESCFSFSQNNREHSIMSNHEYGQIVHSWSNIKPRWPKNFYNPDHTLCVQPSVRPDRATPWDRGQGPGRERGAPGPPAQPHHRGHPRQAREPEPQGQWWQWTNSWNY